jgi:Tol biopolymer transport system component
MSDPLGRIESPYHATLAVGAHIGVYEIVASIGAGGMGEVYRAQDSRLRRDVAIKVLPRSFAADPDSQARLEREARLLAALNHPNIAHIHGLEDTDGVLALVMELVEGDTLADRIARGRIPIKDALPIARQIAEALAAAHDQGIIHRDLKPANVKVRADGSVKVLDFGLAKWTEPAAAADAMNSPTLSARSTQQGLILGTAAYMSPEQASGQRVDRRTDLWSFGVVLFEMLTGRRAFEGETVSHVIAAVLKSEPDWSVLPREIPASVRRLLQRCLTKDPRRRLDSATAAVLELDDQARAEGGDAGATPLSASAASRWYLVGGTLIAVLGLVIGRPFVRSANVASPTLMRLDVNMPGAPGSDDLGLSGSPIVSPEGTAIAFTAAGPNGGQVLWIRQLSDAFATPVAGTADASYPFWSPDGRAVGFFTPGKLKRVDLAGGAPQVLADLKTSAHSGTWNADDLIVFGTFTGAPLLQVSALGGEVRPLTRLAPGDAGHTSPSFLPDGRHLLYTVGGSPDRAGVHLTSLDDPSSSKRILPNAVRAVYAPTGHVLFLVSTNPGSIEQTLFAQEMTPDGRLSGRPVPLGRDIERASVSRNELLVYRSLLGRRQEQLAWFGRDGKSLGVVGPPFLGGMWSIGAVELAPDGRNALVTQTVDGNQDVYVMNLDDGSLTRVTSDAAADFLPLWSPDGRRVVFSSLREPAGLYEKPVGGAQPERLVFAGPVQGASSWSPDGMLMYRLQNNFWTIGMTGETKPTRWTTTPFDQANAQFSPNGKWVAYTSNQSGQYEIYVQAFHGEGRWPISVGGGVEPRWRSDGKELFYLGADRILRAVRITESTDGSSITAAAPQPLFRAATYSGFSANTRIEYAVTHDGERFLIPVAVESATAAPITVVFNWTLALKK